MPKYNFSNEIIAINNFISLNPTGTLNLDNDGTLKMNGPPAIIMTQQEIAKQNLNNINNNTFICDQPLSTLENFENYNLETKSNKNIFIYIIFLLFLLLIFFFIYKKRKI